MRRGFVHMISSCKCLAAEAPALGENSARAWLCAPGAYASLCLVSRDPISGLGLFLTWFVS